MSGNYFEGKCNLVQAEVGEPISVYGMVGPTDMVLHVTKANWPLFVIANAFIADDYVVMLFSSEGRCFFNLSLVTNAWEDFPYDLG